MSLLPKNLKSNLASINSRLFYSIDSWWNRLFKLVFYFAVSGAAVLGIIFGIVATKNSNPIYSFPGTSLPNKIPQGYLSYSCARGATQFYNSPEFALREECQRLQKNWTTKVNVIPYQVKYETTFTAWGRVAAALFSATAAVLIVALALQFVYRASIYVILGNRIKN